MEFKTLDEWVAYTGTTKNFVEYQEARKHCRRSGIFLVCLFGAYALSQVALLAIVLMA